MTWMRTRAGRGAPVAVVAIVLTMLWLAIGSPVGRVLAAQQDEATSAAGFIVDTGEGEPIHVVVTFGDTSMTAVDLLRAADLDSVTVEFGGLGEAVCSIVETGCDVNTCRQRVCQTGDPESPFWQYWEQDEAGWKLSPLGGSHVEVGDGDIAAWVWTGVPPELESIEWAELAERAGAPEEIVQGEVTGEPTVYSSRIQTEDVSGENQAASLVAIGIVVLLGVCGGLLVVRNRRRVQEA